jgi:hypothetical protein
MFVNYGEKKLVGTSKEDTFITYRPSLYSPSSLFSVGYYGKLRIEQLTILHSKLENYVTNLFINKGDLKLTHVEIKPSTSSTEDFYGALLVLLPTSKTVLESVNINNFGLFDSSAIEANDTLLLTVVDCMFSNINKKIGSGGVIQASLIDGTEFLVSNSSFTSCSAAADGGCVYLYLADDFVSSYIFYGDLLSFDSNVNAKRGKAIFIDTFCKEEQVFCFFFLLNCYY